MWAYLFIASWLGLCPEGVERELLLVVIALAAPSGHLIALPGGAGGWQSGRLACIASRGGAIIRAKSNA